MIEFFLFLILVFLFSLLGSVFQAGRPAGMPPFGGPDLPRGRGSNDRPPSPPSAFEPARRLTDREEFGDGRLNGPAREFAPRAAGRHQVGDGVPSSGRAGAGRALLDDEDEGYSTEWGDRGPDQAGAEDGPTLRPAPERLSPDELLPERCPGEGLPSERLPSPGFWSTERGWSGSGPAEAVFGQGIKGDKPDRMNEATSLPLPGENGTSFAPDLSNLLGFGPGRKGQAETIQSAFLWAEIFGPPLALRGRFRRPTLGGGRTWGKVTGRPR